MGNKEGGEEMNIYLTLRKILFLTGVIVILQMLTGCATYQSRYYRDGIRIKKLELKKPMAGFTADNNMAVLKKRTVILPFEDRRDINEIYVGTSEPISLLFAGAFSDAASESLIFKSSGLPGFDELHMKGIKLEEKNIRKLLAGFSAEYLLGGTVDKFEIKIENRNVMDVYLNVSAEGSVYLCSADSGMIYKSTFQANENIKVDYSVAPYGGYNGIEMSGQKIKDFIYKVAIKEIDKIFNKADRINANLPIKTGLPAQTLQYPPDWPCPIYSETDIARAEMGAQAAGYIGAFAGALAGSGIAIAAAGGNDSGLVVGIAAGCAGAGLGYLAGWLIGQGMIDNDIEKAKFIASADGFIITHNFDF
jgi:hypothetical protein